MTDCEYEVSKAKLELIGDLNNFCKDRLHTFWGLLGLVPWSKVQGLAFKWLDQIEEERKLREKKDFKLHRTK